MYPFASARIFLTTLPIWLAAAPCIAVSPVQVALGFTPESVTAAGLSPSQAADLVVRVSAEAELCGALQVHSAAADSATQLVSQLANALAGTADDPQALQGQYETALTQLESAKAQVDQVRQSLFDNVTVALSVEQINRLQAWHDSIGLNVPAQFRVTVRTPEEWANVEMALRAEARAQRLGQALAQEHSQLLANVRAESAVVQAQANLATTLASITSVFESQ